MPDYRSIHISLHSQFDVQKIPEYYPPHGTDYISCDREFIPPSVDDPTSTCSVFVPFLPGSTFWIGYSVSPPVPDGHLFLFKLYINGAHIVNWATDKQEAWKGKTMFGLYESLEDDQNRKRTEKRVLCFSSANDITFDETACVEIKVHRAKGRKRIEREMQEYSRTEHAKNDKGIRLVNAGRAAANQPKRFYKFALIDPIDQPFATFRYYYRTWEQLRDLGLLGDDCYGSGEENDLSVIEPLDDDTSDKENDSESESSSRAGLIEGDIPFLSPPKPMNKGRDEQEQQRLSCTPTPPERSRYPMPPATKPVTPEIGSKPLPPSPQGVSSCSYRPHPVYPDDDCAIRTLSPRRILPVEKHWGRNRSVSSLMKNMAFTWKRQK